MYFIGLWFLSMMVVLPTFSSANAATWPPPVDRDNTTWLEYRDEQRGFIFRYPSSWAPARDLKPYDMDRFFVRLDGIWKKFTFRYDEATNSYPFTLEEEEPQPQSLQTEILLLPLLDEDPPVKVNYLTQIAAFVDVYQWKSNENPRRAILKALRTERVPIGYTPDFITGIRTLSFRRLSERGRTYGYSSLWEIITAPSGHPPWTVIVQRLDLIAPHKSTRGQHEKEMQTVVSFVSTLDLLPRDLFRQLASTIQFIGSE